MAIWLPAGIASTCEKPSHSVTCTSANLEQTLFEPDIAVQIGGRRKLSRTTMSSRVDRVKVFAGIQRHRKYSADQKLAVVQKAARPGMTISYVARRRGIAPSLIFGWSRRMSEGGKEAIRADDEVVAEAEVLVLQKQVRKLQRVLGKQTLGNEILRKAVKLAHKKTDLAVAIVAVKRVAEVLGVSRSQLHERLHGEPKRRSIYRKLDDAELLGPLRALVDEWSTYGYRRIAALMNRERLKNSLPRLNHKRICRPMSQNGAAAATHRQAARASPRRQNHHDPPKLRWASDGLEIACWNGQVVRVAFALDTCDREVLAWPGAPAPAPTRPSTSRFRASRRCAAPLPHAQGSPN